jgi:glycine dehydrogenase subunit 1
MSHPYIPNSVPAVKTAMLQAIGLDSAEDLYRAIPAAIRMDRPLDLPAPARSEAELLRHMRGLLAKNVSTQDKLSFLGGGTFPHHVPAVVDEVINRGEFLTAYAGEPYEDHGRFQALFEYSSQMAELLEMDVVNVPVYDGFQAASTALRMAGRMTGRRDIVLVGSIGADKLSRIRDYTVGALTLRGVPATDDGSVDLAAVRGAISGDTAAIYVETPDYDGVLHAELPDLAAIAHDAGAELVVYTDPIALGVIAPPAALGADIVCGDIQSLGVHQWFGGGHGGYIAVRDDVRYVMELPSRLFGIAATAVPGEYGFGDVAYERTSFAIREEGKEWVGTAAALWGIAAAVYLSLMGPQGMREIGETILANTRYAMRKLAEIPGVSVPAAASAHFREFVVDVSGTGRSAADWIAAGRSAGIEPGIEVGENRLLTCVTEIHTKNDIDSLARLFARSHEPARHAADRITEGSLR